MKTYKNDSLKQFLSKNAPAPAQHPWFTANVLHRLPDRKPRYSWVLRLTYSLAALACLICWSRVIPELASPVITLRTVRSGGWRRCSGIGLSPRRRRWLQPR